MDISSVPLKEAVELIESRIPGGRWLTTVVLSLILLVVMISSFLYIWSRAVIPLAHFITYLVTGATFNVQIRIGTVVVGIVMIGAGWLFNRAMQYIVNRVLTVTERLLTLVEKLTETTQKLS
jgi:CBS domain containing-hemolysin-like protein